MIKLKHCNVKTKKTDNTITVDVNFLPEAAAFDDKIRYDKNDVITALEKSGVAVGDIISGKTNILNNKFQESQRATYVFYLKETAKRTTKSAPRKKQTKTTSKKEG